MQGEGGKKIKKTKKTLTEKIKIPRKFQLQKGQCSVTFHTFPLSINPQEYNQTRKFQNLIKPLTSTNDRRLFLEMEKTDDKPAIGIPYSATMPQQQHHHYYYVGNNPYQAGMIPPNAVFGDPKGIPIQQTMYKDTPAPFNCVYCGSSGLTTVR